MRRLLLICLALAALATAAFVGCGGDDDSASPPGSPDNPLAATHPQEAVAGSPNNEAEPKAKGNASAASGQESTAPGFEKLVDRQSKRPASRFSPCNLVTRDEAAGILRSAIEVPFEAPQGPTCIYKGRSGSPFVTVAVQQLDFAQVERQLRKRRRVEVAGMTGYCGSYGRETLYVPLDDERVLSISSRCDQAAKFAKHAIPRLPA